MGSFASSDIYLDGGCIVYKDDATLPVFFTIFLKESDGHAKREFSVITSYWRIK